MGISLAEWMGEVPGEHVSVKAMVRVGEQVRALPKGPEASAVR